MLKRCRWRTVLAVLATFVAGALALSTAALASSSHSSAQQATRSAAPTLHIKRAHTLSGTKLQIGTSDGKVLPSVVVDPSGDAYVAWDFGTGNGTTQIDICQIAPGASACGSQTNVSAPGNPALGNISLALDNGDVVLESEQFGSSTNKDDNYVNEWTSPDGMNSFTAVDGGESVAPTDGGYSAQNIFTLPGSTDLGFAYGTVGANNFYVTDITPFNAPPECSEVTESNNNNTCPSTPTATLNPTTNSNVVSQGAEYYASQGGTDPGVLGVMDTASASGCPSGSAGDGISYVYGAGNQSSTNSYGISPGTTGSAWQFQGVKPIDCNASEVTADSGKDGLGILEDNEASSQMQYRVFDQQTQVFSSPINVTPAKAAGAGSSPYLDQDAAGGMFAEWDYGNSVYPGPQELAYSPDGGGIWDGPVALTNNTTTPEIDPFASVGSSGQGWLEWEEANGNGTQNDDNVYLQQFDSADVPADPTTMASVESYGATHAAKLTLTAPDAGETDTIALAGTNAAYATGTVKFSLLAGSCDPGLTLATYNEGTATVSAGKATSSAVGVLQPGTYYWEAVYYGDANNAPVAEKCGSEVMVVNTPTTVGSTVTDNGTDLGIGVTCTSGTTCLGSLTITGTYSVGSGKAAKTTTKTLTLASGKFSFKTKGSHTVKLKLTSSAKKFLKSKHPVLTARATMVEYYKGHKIVSTKTVKLKA